MLNSVKQEQNNETQLWDLKATASPWRRLLFGAPLACSGCGGSIAMWS